MLNKRKMREIRHRLKLTLLLKICKKHRLMLNKNDQKLRIKLRIGMM